MINCEWRQATPADRPALEEIQRQLNEATGKDYELPDLNSKAIPFAMVAVRDGKVIGAWMAEAVLELKFASVDPGFTAAARRDCWDVLCAMAQAQGIRWIQCPVPPEPKDRFKRISEALETIDMHPSENAFFIKDLR